MGDLPVVAVLQASHEVDEELARLVLAQRARRPGYVAEECAAANEFHNHKHRLAIVGDL